MCYKIPGVILALAVLSGAETASNPSAPSSSGGASYPQPAGSGAVQTYDNNGYSAQSGSGTVLHHVNMLTGGAAYSVPIAQIGIGKAAYPIVLGYGGQTRQQLYEDNETWPTSWIGFGWGFSAPFVSINHKGTVNNDDDVFYCSLGKYGGGQLLRKDANTFFLGTDPAVKIRANLDASGFITTWEFILPDGVRMVFGSVNSNDYAERFMVRFDGTLVSSPYHPPGGVIMKYRWDLAVMDGRPAGATYSERLEFRYSRFDIPLASGRNFTRESYLKEVVAVNAWGKEVEKYRFNLSDKGSDEYAAISHEKNSRQATMETKALESIEYFIAGGVNVERKWSVLPTYYSPGSYKKRFLDSIQITYRTTAGTYITDPAANWKFMYDNGAGHYYGLNRISQGSVREDIAYSRADYTNPAWADSAVQDPNAKLLAAPTLAAVVNLPTGTDLRDNWKTNSFCTERFCFVNAFGYNTSTSTETLYLQVWKNNGNYFTLANLQGSPFGATFSSSRGSLSVIPWNDNFIVLDAKSRTFTLYEWDGETFLPYNNIIKRRVNQTLSPIQALNDPSKPLKIILGSDFFLVEQDGFLDACAGNATRSSSSKLYVIRKVDGIWRDLNQEECVDMSTCVNGLPGAAGGVGAETYPTGSGKCLEFPGTDLFVSASQSLFHVVHRPTNIVLTFAQSQSGKSFKDISNLYPIGNPQTESNCANNWKDPITMPIQSGNDFFLIPTHHTASTDNENIDIYHYNGTAVYRVGVIPNISSINFGSTSIWCGGDYFIHLTKPFSTAQGTAMSITRKIISTTNGTPTGMSFSTVPFLSNLSPADDYLVKATPKIISVEKHVAFSIVNGAPTKPPMAVSATGNYFTWLFEYNPALAATVTDPPFQQITSLFKDAKGRNIFNITPSYAGNFLTGESCVKPDNTSACTGGVDELITFRSAMLSPGLAAGGPTINSQQSVYAPLTAGAHWNFNQYNFSSGSRLGVVTRLNDVSHKVEFRLLQWMGTGFTRYPYFNEASTGVADFDLVSSTKVTSGLTGSGRGNWTEYGFTYLPSTLFTPNRKADFNTHSLSLAFPNSAILTYKGSEAMTASNSIKLESVTQTIDQGDSPIPERLLGKVGLTTQARIFDVDGSKAAPSLGQEVSRTDNEYYDPAPFSTWPDKLAITRLRKTTQINWALNKSHQTRSTAYFKYLPENNQPVFSKTNLGGKWYLNQSVFPSTPVSPYLATESYTFRFDSEPLDATLEAWTDVSKVYDQDGAAQKAISASKVEFDASFPGLVSKTKLWRDVDATLDDTELKTGADPVFFTNSGWEDRTSVLQRNTIGLPLESSKILAASGTSRPTAYFYEGLRQDLVGTVDNCPLSDAAILTAENAPMQTSSLLDTEGRWGWVATAGSSNSANPHMGRFSLDITDNPGLLANLKLSGGPAMQSDYVVSAWIYANTVAPVMTVQRFQKTGSGANALNTFTRNSPAGQSFTAKNWQRYEIRLTAAQLRGSENLFSTLNSGDFLQVKIGTGATVGDGRKISVDDIVCRPANSAFGLFAYDKQGHLIHSMNTNHFITTQEYDAFGKLSVTRDDRYRGFSSTAVHAIGEND